MCFRLFEVDKNLKDRIVLFKLKASCYFFGGQCVMDKVELSEALLMMLICHNW